MSKKLILRRLWILFAAIFMVMMLGCSTQKSEQQAPENAVASESPAVVLPYTLDLSGNSDGDTVTIVMTLHVQDALPAPFLVVLEPEEDTEVMDMALETRIPAPKGPGDITRTFRIRGDSPAVEVYVSQSDRGFGVEVHESYPPRKDVQRSPLDIRKPLPAPIEVEGAIIESGVEVKP